MGRPGLNLEQTRLLLASAERFTDELRQLSVGRPDVILVDADRLYSGN